MEIKMMKVDDLIPYVNNPRHNENAIDKVAGSIKEFGFKVPLVIDKDNIVVTGHTRLLASKKLGLEQVPCVIANDLTKAQIKAFRIADNKVSEYATWDNELLKVELEELEELDFDLDSINIDFSDFDLDIELDDYDEELELERGEQKVDTLKYIKFNKYEIPLTDEEFEQFNKVLDEYVEETGVLYGFATRLLEGK